MRTSGPNRLFSFKTHSQPALVESALEGCCCLPLLDPIVEQLCGSHLQRPCPSTLHSASGRPESSCLTVSTMEGRTSALANLSPRRNVECSADGWSKSGWRCSTVIPEGPAATRLRADLNFLLNFPSLETLVNPLAADRVELRGGNFNTFQSWSGL